MSYELSVAWKTLKKEGVSSLLTKTRIYFSQLSTGLTASLAGRPARDDVEGVIDYSYRAARGIFQPGQVRSEILELARRFSTLQPRTIVEIGTATGGTLFIWCSLARPDATIISIDLPGGIHGGGYPYWKTRLYQRFATDQQRLILLRGDSHSLNMLDLLKKEIRGQQIDFLFIDGDHTYDGVKQDFDMYSPLVRKGGLIAFHDICEHPPVLDCHVDEYWNDLKKQHPAEEIIENPKQGWGGIGLIEAK